jgi:hypothetical protein
VALIWVKVSAKGQPNKGCKVEGCQVSWSERLTEEATDNLHLTLSSIPWTVQRTILERRRCIGVLSLTELKTILTEDHVSIG